jgi:hypothetical protein
MVESDEFTEIEDPDPENHQKRQRELINEIEEARKGFEKKEQKGGRFTFFSRKKKTVERKEWESYEESKGDPDESGSRSTEDRNGNNHGVLFDIDAIRAELASEQMEVRELQSTLPPMKLDLSDSNTTSRSPRSSLRETKSDDPSTMLKVNDFKSSPSSSPPRGQSSIDLPQDLAQHQSNPRQHSVDDIQMAFDTSYHSPPLSTSSAFNKLPVRPPQPAPPLAEPTERAVTLQRPELKSSNTLPAISLEHNAWADDDEDFVQEREIEMTFA